MAEPLTSPREPGPRGAAAGGPDPLDRLLGADDFVRNPYAVYRRLRQEDPVHWCVPWGAWVVSRHEDVMEVLDDPDIRFTTSPQNVMKYANFMADVGSIKQRPAKWQDMFFPDIHGVKGD